MVQRQVSDACGVRIGYRQPAQPLPVDLLVKVSRRGELANPRLTATSQTETALNLRSMSSSSISALARTGQTSIALQEPEDRVGVDDQHNRSSCPPSNATRSSSEIAS